jgi:cold-inducible RNA-binding protein
MPKLFFGNIPHATSVLELTRWVESRGFRVDCAEIIYDRISGKPRGFGFVTLHENNDTRSAIKLLNGRRIRGRIITVAEAAPFSEQVTTGQR